jgi:hypothetical protein
MSYQQQVGKEALKRHDQQSRAYADKENGDTNDKV